MYMFEVCAKCGHVGKSSYTEKVFAITANSSKEAAAIARSLPRVKHHHKDAIRYVMEIDESRYNEIREENSCDPYFKCKSIQQQRAQCELIIFDEYVDDARFLSKKEEQHRPKYYGKKTLRNPKKYINNYITEQRYAI